MSVQKRFSIYMSFSENGKELLSMNEVLSHLLRSSKPLIPKENLAEIINLPLYKWQSLVDEVKGAVEIIAFLINCLVY